MAAPLLPPRPRLPAPALDVSERLRNAARMAGRYGGWRGAASAAIGLAIGLALGASLWSGPDTPTPAGETSGDLSALREALESERRARRALAAEAEQLRAELAARAGSPEAAGADPIGDLLEAEAEAEDAQEAEGSFDAVGLELAGYTAAEIDRLRERHEQLELDRLYLENLARREGWRNRPRFQNELRGLRAEVRAEVGDDDYDAMLYAAGRRNRVIVATLLANSAAEAAGVRPGDALVRYAGERIFEPFALVRATADGVLGAPTELRVERGGEEIRLFLPRGPIGVRLSRERRAPTR